MQDVNLNHLHQIHGKRTSFRLIMFSEIAKPFNLKLPKDSLSSADTQLQNTSPGLSLANA